jgi:hypothetical protein
MSFPPSVYKTWVAGETLTAADLNNSFLAPINSNIPEDTDDFSVNQAEMQTQTDPYPASAVSLSTSLSEEIARLRHAIAQAKGTTYWYEDPVVVIGSVGLTVPTPDGTKTYLIGVDNDGLVIATRVS